MTKKISIFTFLIIFLTAFSYSFKEGRQAQEKPEVKKEIEKFVTINHRCKEHSPIEQPISVSGFIGEEGRFIFCEIVSKNNRKESVYFSIIDDLNVSFNLTKENFIASRE